MDGTGIGRHLVHSHAHEETPGTVNLRIVVEGDDSAYGQAYYPGTQENVQQDWTCRRQCHGHGSSLDLWAKVLTKYHPIIRTIPSKLVAHALQNAVQILTSQQWPRWKKDAVLVVQSLYSFFCNSTLIGSSVYINVYAEAFDVSPTRASQTSSWPTFAFGCGCLILIPMYVKFGRRPTMLLSEIIYTFAVLGCARATTFSGFMAARCIHAAASGVCEALPIQCVNDVYFLHERGKRISYYTAALCLGSIGPLPAGYMLAGGYSFRLFFYIEFAIGIALVIAAFFLCPETALKRKVKVMDGAPPECAGGAGLDRDESIATAQKTVEVEAIPVMRQRKSYLASLNPWSGIDHDADFFMMMIRSFSYYLVPHVLWVICSFGIYIGCAALAFNYTFPGLIVEPPYNWNPINSGLIATAFVIGYGLALPFSNSSDRLAAHLTVKNGGIREAEMRLGVMLPAVVIGPAGLVVYGCTAQYQLHWVGYFAGVAMVDWSALFFFTFTLAYCIDSYTANMSEFLIAMQIGKNAISFGMGFSLLTWVTERGYAVVIAGAFGAIMFANNVCILVFMMKGREIRVFWSQTWLARFHRSTVRSSGTETI